MADVDLKVDLNIKKALAGIENFRASLNAANAEFVNFNRGTGASKNGIDKLSTFHT